MAFGFTRLWGADGNLSGWGGGGGRKHITSTQGIFPLCGNQIKHSIDSNNSSLN